MGGLCCGKGNSPAVNENQMSIPINDVTQNLRQAEVIPGFKGLAVTPSSLDYVELKYQYATTSYPAKQMSPGMIVYPRDVDDIKAVLKYAPKNKKNVLVRSGGCQYSGLSSGNMDDIIIDMQSFDKREVIDGNILKIGPCNRLGNVGPFLNKHGIAMPMGDCECVNIGGHVQTGGYGNILRGFGLCLDHIISFDIIKADGELMHITKPKGIDVSTKPDEKEEKKEDNNNDKMYWAVMGGNPGSFGIVTEWQFECIKDSDHPNSAGVQAIFLYDNDVLKNMLNAFTDLLEKEKELPPDYDFMFTIASVPKIPFVGAIYFEGAYTNVKGADDDYNPEYFDKILNAAGIDPKYKKFDGKTSISEMMVRFVKHINREYEYPYKKMLRGATKPWDRKFVDSYCEWAEKMMELTGFDDGFKYESQIQMGGGAYYTNDPYSKITSISHRDIIIGFTFNIFYDDKWNKNAEKDAIKYHQETKKIWIDQGLFNVDKQDIRMTWGTFGNTNIEEVWQYYYDDQQKYDKLRTIKTHFDPSNIFSNRFTIPPMKY